MNFSFELPRQQCPFCGFKIEACTLFGPNMHYPKDGDINICSECTEVGIFNRHGQIRKVTPNDIKEITKSGEWTAVLKHQQVLKARNLVHPRKKIKELDL